jgi:hypothetical protein
MNATQPFSCEPSFEPELGKLIFDVFDEIIQSLGHIARPRIVHEAIAKHIIEAVEDGERDPDRISQGVLRVVALRR